MYNIFRYVSQSVRRLLTGTTHKSSLHALLNDNTINGMNTTAGRTQNPVKPTQLPEIQTFLKPGYPIFIGDCDSTLKVELDYGKNNVKKHNCF